MTLNLTTSATAIPLTEVKSQELQRGVTGYCDTFGSIYRQPKKQPVMDDLVKVPVLKVDRYVSCMVLSVSDHKPVSACVSIDMTALEDYERKKDNDKHPMLSIDPHYRWKRPFGYSMGFILGFILMDPAFQNSVKRCVFREVYGATFFMLNSFSC